MKTLAGNRLWDKEILLNWWSLSNHWEAVVAVVLDGYIVVGYYMVRKNTGRRCSRTSSVYAWWSFAKLTSILFILVRP